MTTFLKIVFFLFVGFVLIHLWPILAVPFAAVTLVALVIGGALTGGVALVFSLGLVLAAVVLCAGFGIALALSPIWIPVLIVVGMISLIRRGSRRTS